MSSPSVPTPPTPQQAAQAQSLAQTGGTMLDIGSIPEQAYAEALDQIAFNPVFQQSQSATQANSALANAKSNQAISAMTNPYGTAGTNSFNREASQRLSDVMGEPYMPGLTQSNTAGVFQYPTTQELPNLSNLINTADAIASAIPSVNMSDNQVSLMNKSIPVVNQQAINQIQNGNPPQFNLPYYL